MSTGGMLIVIAVALWCGTEVMEFLRRRRAGQSVLTSENRGSGWLRAVNAVALVIACVGFVMWLTQDQRFFGIGV